MHFFTDSCAAHEWGYKFTLFALMEDALSGDWFSALHRTTCWLASKCSA